MPGLTIEREILLLSEELDILHKEYQKNSNHRLINQILRIKARLFYLQDLYKERNELLNDQIENYF